MFGASRFFRDLVSCTTEFKNCACTRGRPEPVEYILTTVNSLAESLTQQLFRLTSFRAVRRMMQLPHRAGVQTIALRVVMRSCWLLSSVVGRLRGTLQATDHRIVPV